MKRTLDLVVSRSKLRKVFRSEGPRHTPVEQGLNHLSLQQSDLKAKGGNRPIVQLRPLPFEAFPHGTDPLVDLVADTWKKRAKEA